MKHTFASHAAAVILAVSAAVVCAAEPAAPESRTVRIAATQPAARRIDWHIKDAAEVLKHVDENLAELEQLIDKAKEQRCDAVAFPENTMGLNKWLQGNPERAKEIIAQTV